MFEAYAVGISLKLNNLVSPQLALIGQELLKLDGLVSTLGANFKALGAGKAAFAAIATSANASAKAIEKANISAASFTRHLGAIQAGAAGIGPMPAIPGGRYGVGGWGQGGGGAGGGSGGHGGGFGAYRHGGNIHLGPGGIGLGTVGIGAGGAFWPLAATGAMLWGGHSLFESAKSLDTEQQRFRLYGMSENVNREAFDYVRQSKSFGVSWADRMKLMREAQGVGRESGQDDAHALHFAKLALPLMAQLQFATAALGDEGKAKSGRDMLAALRFVEMSGGANDPTKFKDLLDLGYRLSSTSGGQVNFEALRQFRAHAGAAGWNIGGRDLAMLEPIIAELKGNVAGTAVRTGYGRLTGAVHLPNQIAHMLVDQGLWDGGKVNFNSHGGIKSFAKGGPLSSEMLTKLSESPVTFYADYIAPMYQRMKLDSNQIALNNAEIFGRNGGKFYDLISKQMDLLKKSAEATDKAAGLAQAVNAGRQSLSGKELEFIAAWDDFKTAFSGSVLPGITGVLTGGTSVLRAATVTSARRGEKGFTFLDLMTGNLSRDFLGELLRGDPGGGRGFINPTDHVRARPLGSGLFPNFNPVAPLGAFAAGGGAGPVYLDGELVGKHLDKRAAKAFGRPQTGVFTFDASALMMPAGGVSR